MDNTEFEEARYWARYYKLKFLWMEKERNFHRGLEKYNRKKALTKRDQIEPKFEDVVLHYENGKPINRPR